MKGQSQMPKYVTMDIKTLRGYGEKYLDHILGRLAAEQVTEFTNKNLESALGPCACGHWLVPVAKQLRDDGKLSACGQ